MLELKKKELKFKFDGNEYTITHPTVKQVKELQGELKKKDADSFELMLDLFDKLGLPKDVAEEMEPEHLQIIEENLMGQKKS